MRIEMNGMVIEGTVEELREIGVKFPIEEGASEGESATKFEVGDYVVPLPESDEEYGVTNTDMYAAKVIEVRSDGEIVIEIVAHKDEQEVGWEYPVEPKYFRKATDEEARWARIGRKPGEFKKGDIVRYTPYTGRTCHGLKDYPGIITEVDDVSNGFIYVKKPEFVKSEYGTASAERELELIVPVEQRFDFANAQSVAAEGARQ
jgi:hypothetical protein